MSQLPNAVKTFFKNGHIKDFYELESREYLDGSRLTEVHENSLSMLNLGCKDVVLDIACGGGVLSAEIAKKGATAVGLDISEAQIKYAKAHVQDVSLIVGEAEKLPFKDNAFTRCLALEILEHVQNPDQMMREVYRVLKSEGELIIVVPNDRNWFVHRILEGYFHEARRDHGHLHDLSSLKKLRPFIKGFQILMIKENKVHVMPMSRIIDLLFRSLKIIKRPRYVEASRRKREKTFTYTLQKLVFSIAPKLTLHLIIYSRKL